MVLGDYGIITVDEARNMARLKLADIIKGIGPISKKKKTPINNFGSFALRYIEDYAKKHKKTWVEDERKINKHLISIWGSKEINSITKPDVLSLHHNIGSKTPYEANRLIRLLSKMFQLAKEWDYLKETDPNPTKNIKLFKEEKRDRWLTPEELPRLIEAIEKENNIFARSAILLYLLTGVRKTELLTAQWKDIDFVRKELRLEETKAGRIHYVPLSKPAIELLENIPRFADNPYILPGNVEGQPIINISKPWNRIRKAASLEDVRLHDLRRTVGSWLAQAGNSLHLIGKVLNHSNESTTAIYARFGQDNVRQALENHGEQLMNIVKKK